MVADALKGYVQLANGLTDVTKGRASAAAKAVAAQSPDLLGVAATTATAAAVNAALQVQKLAEELYVTSRDNRELLLGVIRTEVERVVSALGFAKEADVEAVRSKVDRLEETVEGRDDSESSPSLRAALNPTKKLAPKKAAPKKVAAKKVVPKKSSAKKAAPKKVAAKKSSAKKVAAKKVSTVPAAAVPASPVEVLEPVRAPAAPEIVDLTRSSAPTAVPLTPPAAPPVPESLSQQVGDGGSA